MLRESTVEYLTQLTYRADAKRRVCLLPVTGIYWEDEIPDFMRLTKLAKEAQYEVLRLFAIRHRIWNLESLSEDDKSFWDDAQLQAPQYALFRRLELSATDRKLQNRIVRETDQAFREIEADADEVHITERYPGVQQFSLTFDLTKRDFTQKKSWWSRLFSKH